MNVCAMLASASESKSTTGRSPPAFDGVTGTNADHVPFSDDDAAPQSGTPAPSFDPAATSVSA